MTVGEAVNFLGLRDVDKAAEKLEVLRKSLRHPQKIIKLADKSKAGWLAVKQYEAEELASDSDDEKRIRKVQERALKKNQNALEKSIKFKPITICKRRTIISYQRRNAFMFCIDLVHPC